MSTRKCMDRICVLAVVVALLITVLFMNGEALGIKVAATVMGYEKKLFDNTKVHTIDIIMDDWDGFLATAQSEVYSMCDVVIDGEPINNVGIRGKGNTSLMNVSAMGSQRYSFKIEFDQYDSTKSYYGLDKLSLNNMIQDNTMMKDYLAYSLMGKEEPVFSGKTMTGALMRHTITPTANFQPMNSNFGILEPLGERVRGKKFRYEKLADRAIEEMNKTVEMYQLNG